MEFLAIGALCGKAHTYRHDLESFFYVFLWVCIYYSPNGAVEEPSRILEMWGGSSYTDAATAKVGHMDPGRFETVVAEFSESAVEMKDLVWKLRDVLFPWRDRLFTGTERDIEPVYEAVLQAFTDAIRAIGGE